MSEEKLGQQYLAALHQAFPGVVLDEAWQTKDQLTITVKVNYLPEVVEFLYYQQGGWLSVLFGNDERQLCGHYAVYYGSVAIDDEGTPGQYNVLIENGVLKGYMQDKLNARLMGAAPTGNGRRESYAHLPMPRMTNTYMLAGQSTPQEIIESVEYGIYAPNFGGGQVDITSGKFVFSTSEAYLIENGKVTTPVKGATLIGSGIETMQQISMVGNDLKLDNGVGVCGKEGQSLPVGVGQPTLKVDNLTVGGTA